VASYNWSLPFPRAFPKAPSRLTHGWNFVGISRFSTGFPITMGQSAGDQSLTGDSANDTPNLIGPVVTQNAHNPGPNGPNTYFLPGAFTTETYGGFGTSPRRFIIGPGFLNTDFALEKDTRIAENMSVQFRAEFFNIFNHTQFNNPSGDFSSSQFGVVTSARDPRIGQLSLKFLF
jgi:hypothetical protein